MYRKTSYYMNYVPSRKIDFLWDSVYNVHTVQEKVK